jgi:hypothetical protein
MRSFKEAVEVTRLVGMLTNIGPREGAGAKFRRPYAASGDREMDCPEAENQVLAAGQMPEARDVLSACRLLRLGQPAPAPRLPHF